MADVAVRTSGIGTSASATTVSVTKPAGTASGDLAVCIPTFNGNVGISDANSGFAFTEQLADFQETSGGQTASVFYRIIDGSEGSSFSFSTSGAADRCTVVALIFSSPNSGTPFDVAPAGGNSQAVTVNTFTPNSSSITTASDKAIHVIAVLPDGSSTAITGTPAGYTIPQNSGNQTIAVGYKQITPAGATGAQTWTCAVNEQYITLSFAIKNNTGGATGHGPLMAFERNSALAPWRN